MMQAPGEEDGELLRDPTPVVDSLAVSTRRAVKLWSGVTTLSPTMDDEHVPHGMAPLPRASGVRDEKGSLHDHRI